MKRQDRAVEYALAMPLTLVALVYSAVFNPTQIEAGRRSVLSTYLSVVLLLVQAPSIRSTDSQSPRVTSLSANILISRQMDVTSESIPQCSKPLQ